MEGRGVARHAPGLTFTRREARKIDKFLIAARDPLFFMHVPKTAGVSMRLYLRNQYSSADILAEDWWSLLENRENIKRSKLALGHFPYNLRSILPDGTRMLTIVRDPVQRTLSALKHLMRDPSFHPDHVLTKGLTLAEVIRNKRLMSNQRNVLASYLCASKPPSAVFDYLQAAAAAGRGRVQPRELEAPPTLPLAMERLHTIDFIGTTDRLVDVASQMSEVMKFHPTTHFPLFNEDPTPTRSTDLNESDLAILQEYNDLDIPLFAYAKALIIQRRFERSMSDLIASGIYQIPEGSFEVDVGGVIPGSGWYGAEHDGKAVWRWTGPGREFSLELPLRSDSSFELTLSFMSLPPYRFAIASAEANGQSLPLRTEGTAGMLHTKMLIPQELLARHRGLCRLVFNTGGVSRPSAGADIRLLGVLVYKIAFERLP